jgi:diguanylate cyclase (GGDEF)-like protein
MKELTDTEEILMEFINSKEWKQLRRIFLARIGSPCWVLNEFGKFIYKTPQDSRHCQLIKKDYTLRKRCEEEYLPSLIKEVETQKKPVISSCYSGFLGFAYPLIFHRETIGIVGGCQVLDGNLQMEFYKERAMQLKIDSDELYSMIMEAYSISPNLLHGMIELAFLISQSFIDKNIGENYLFEADLERVRTLMVEAEDLTIQTTHLGKETAKLEEGIWQLEYETEDKEIKLDPDERIKSLGTEAKRMETEAKNIKAQAKQLNEKAKQLKSYAQKIELQVKRLEDQAARLESQAEELNFLYFIGMEITALDDAEEILKLIVCKIQPFFDCELATYLLMEDEEIKVGGKRAYPISERLLYDTRMKLEKIWEEHQEEEIPQLMASFSIIEEEDSTTIQVEPAQEFNSSMNVILKDKDKMIGLLAVFSCKENAFDSLTQRLLAFIADIAALAIGRIRSTADTSEVLLERDKLTQTYNIKYFKNYISKELLKADNYNQPLSLIILELDNFKEVNDRYGKTEADNLLCVVVREIKKCIKDRPNCIARVQNDRFIICLPNMNSEEALAIAYKIRDQIKKEEFFIEKDPKHPYKTTACIGIVTYPKENIKDKDKLIDYLEMSLKKAKSKGKNQIEVY